MSLQCCLRVAAVVRRRVVPELVHGIAVAGSKCRESPLDLEEMQNRSARQNRWHILQRTLPPRLPSPTGLPPSLFFSLHSETCGSPSVSYTCVGGVPLPVLPDSRSFVYHGMYQGMHHNLSLQRVVRRRVGVDFVPELLHGIAVAASENRCQPSNESAVA